MTYVNKNKYGQSEHRNSIAPYDIKVSGVKVEWEGAMSSKTFDMANQEGLVSHSWRNGYEKPFNAYCHTEADALKLAEILRQNPNY